MITTQGWIAIILASVYVLWTFLYIFYVVFQEDWPKILAKGATPTAAFLKTFALATVLGLLGPFIWYLAFNDRLNSKPQKKKNRKHLDPFFLKLGNILSRVPKEDR